MEETWTLELYKVSTADGTTKLSGAVFALYSSDEDEKMSDDDYGNLDAQPDKTVEAEDGDGTAITWYLYQVVTTDSNGYASWSGLKDGEEYYLVEVQPPDGYSIDYEPSVVSQNSDEATVTLTVGNMPGVELPKTGGLEFWLYLAAGIIFCGGIGYLVYRRRKRA